MRLSYKMKLPKPIFQLGMSKNGEHLVIGLVDGSLIIRSKKLDEFKPEIDDEQKMIMNAF